MEGKGKINGKLISLHTEYLLRPLKKKEMTSQTL